MDENKRHVVLAQSKRRLTQMRLFGPYDGYEEADQVRADLEVSELGALYVFVVRRVFEHDRTHEVLREVAQPKTLTDAPRAPRKLSDAMSDYHIPDL